MATETQYTNNIEPRRTSSPSPSVGVSEAHEASGGATSPLGAPHIFDYRDFRSFLKDWFGWKKQVSRGYSGATFARKAGLQSHTLLGMVIRGERNVGYHTIRSFTKALSLKGREKIFFEKLVLFNQAETSEDRSDFFEQLVSLAEGSGREILTQLKDYARYLSHWYVAAVHELVLLEDFKADPEWISAKLKRKITKKEAAEAWDILLSLGMVRLDPASGRFAQIHVVMDFDSGEVNFAIRNFHKEFLDRAREAVDGEPIEERELSSLTLAVAQEDLPGLREKVKEFRKHINLIYTKKNETRQTGKPDRVVSVNMQLLVLSDGPEKQRESENKKGERK